MKLFARRLCRITQLFEQICIICHHGIPRMKLYAFDANAELSAHIQHFRQNNDNSQNMWKYKCDRRGRLVLLMSPM
jgi:hypothetical protein